METQKNINLLNGYGNEISTLQLINGISNDL